MKRVLVVVCIVVAFVAVAMMSGCAGPKPMAPSMTGGGEGAAKQPVDMGKSNPSGTMTGGGEGAAKPGIDMGKPAPSGTMTGGGEGAAKPGIQWPQPK